MVIMKKILIKLNNGILHHLFLAINLAIHFNILNSIEFSPIVRHSMEKFGIPIPLLHPMLLGSLPPKNINLITQQS